MLTRRKFLGYAGATVGTLLARSSLLSHLASAQAVRSQVWRHGLDVADIRTFDPMQASVFGEIVALRAMGNGLVRYPPEKWADLEAIEPDLAESWSKSATGLSWTFRLRRGVQFHKGYGELTAEDVVAHFERVRDPRGGSPYRGGFANVSDIKVLDRYTIRFNLTLPDPFFILALVASRAGNIVSKKAVESLGREFGTAPVLTGPFVLSEYVPRVKYVLTRNDRYFRGKPILERLEFLFMPDATSRTIALKARGVESITGVLDKVWIADVARADMVVDPQLHPGYGWLLFYNLARKPLDDLRVRQALSYAINRQEIVAFLGEAIAKPLYSVVPPNYFGHTTEGVERYDYNPDRARELLRAAGQTNLSLTASVSQSALYLPIFQIIQEQWRRVGVNLEIKVVDHSTYHTLIRRDANPVIGYTISREPLARVVFEQWFSKEAIVGKPTAVTNFSHYGDVLAPGIDDMLARSRRTFDLKALREMFEDAQRKIAKDLPAFPIVHFGFPIVRQPYADPGYTPATGMDDAGYNFNEKSRLRG